MTKNIPQNKEDEIIYLKKKGCERFLSMLCQQRNASSLQNRILQTNDNKAMQTNNNMRPCKSDNTKQSAKHRISNKQKRMKEKKKFTSSKHGLTFRF